MKVICSNCGQTARGDSLCDACFRHAETRRHDLVREMADKRRHDELASERAAGRREVKDKVLAEIRDRRIEVAGAPIQWREINELLKRIEALLATE